MKPSPLNGRQRINAACILVVCLFSAGCTDRSPDNTHFADMEVYEKEMPGRQAMRSESTADFEVSSPEVYAGSKKIIRSGSMGLKVDNLEDARRLIDTIMAAFGSYIANETFNDFEHESIYALTVRIPADSFDAFLEGIEKTGYRVLNKNISARDVTEEFIDLEMRLANRRMYLERYNELLKQARTIKDMIDIAENTRRLEEEIESATGRLKYLSGQVEFSTLYLTLTQEKEFRFLPGRRGGFYERLRQSVSMGWYGLIDFSLYIIRLWPLWIILILLVVLIKRTVNRKKG
jgi:hypothetical protein